MKYLVTGGAGFIGSHWCERLITEGHEVWCLDNFVTGSQKNIAPLQANKRFTLIEHDISQPIDLAIPFDRILHLACPASPIDYLKLPIQTMKVGALGTYHVLGIAKRHNSRFLLASTSEVYGDPEVHPQVESYWGNVNPIGPRSVYDEAKRFAEAITMAYRREHGVNTRIVRIFNTYGPRMRHNDGRVVPAFITQALKGEPITVFGDGRQTRSFCFYTDLIEGMNRLVESDFPGPMNCGNPREMTMLAFAKKILEATGSKSQITFKPLPKDDPTRRRPDITKARELMNWEPVVTLDKGLVPTIAYFKEVLEFRQ